MGIRIKYARTQNSNVKSQKYLAKPDPASQDKSRVKIYEKLDDAVRNGLSNVKDNETLYILPTYSAMLEVRKILTGKKIL
jgi:UDP-N-acetylmuramyl tripeptide synthase